jgi:hypothetical protein
MKSISIQIFYYLKIILQITAFCVVCFVVVFFILRSFAPLPLSAEHRNINALMHLEGLSKSLRRDHGAQKMQAVFPEGACFTLTLYGLSWTNLAKRFPEDQNLQKRAISESLWVYDQYDRAYVAKRFKDTQVKNGVFWLGQKNLLTAQLLEIMPKGERPAHIVDGFHQNSRALAAAFHESPTIHIDTYPGKCWPADNVAAFVSLLIHDRLYNTDYGNAYREWVDWTLAHSDPKTGLPAGQINRKSGKLLQPARGCANSWILGLLGPVDAGLAQKWYLNYEAHFLIKRLGFRMFREYRKGLSIRADVDSGPIVLGAGLAATGIGLSSSIANADYKTAADIHALANMWGLPGSVVHNSQKGKQYLFGLLPTGDAFLTWAYSLPSSGNPISQVPGFPELLRSRAVFYIPAAIICVLLVLRGYFLGRSIVHNR